MDTTLKSLIETALPVSPDGRHSLAWSWGGTIGIFELKYGEPLLSFREEHGAIMRAGFSPDMRRLIAENEDRSFSIWHMDNEIDEQEGAETGNIVDFMLNNDFVPCLNIAPGLKVCRFEHTLHDFSDAQYDYYDWGNHYCAACAWYKPACGTCCILRTGCEFRLKIPAKVRATS
ncbi:MAG: WD40 repeat domain-containing protein [Elusimicrobiales bacterium]|nr:WD40 repeat domain-containing protein [Elusimicrobiales bacterium]